jgi:hypothetical protein
MKTLSFVNILWLKQFKWPEKEEHLWESRKEQKKLYPRMIYPFGNFIMKMYNSSSNNSHKNKSNDNNNNNNNKSPSPSSVVSSLNTFSQQYRALSRNGSYRYYAEKCALPEMHLIYTFFKKLALYSQFHVIGCHYIDRYLLFLYFKINGNSSTVLRLVCWFSIQKILCMIPAITNKIKSNETCVSIVTFICMKMGVERTVIISCILNTGYHRQMTMSEIMLM